jgi:hypothetical protein
MLLVATVLLLVALICKEEERPREKEVLSV